MSTLETRETFRSAAPPGGGFIAWYAPHYFVTETVVSPNNQTSVPAEIRQREGVGAGTVVVWEYAGDGKYIVRFRKRKRLADIAGIAGFKGDAVALKRRAQEGGA